jgi:metal-dependent amidase/aminoacylase/carboxypeptidase family protein
MLLTAAEVIASHRATLKGSVKLLFQPAEEFGGGAKYMVRDGVLEGVDQV